MEAVPSALTMDQFAPEDTEETGVCISGSSMGTGSTVLWQGDGVGESCFDCCSCTRIKYTIGAGKIEIEKSTCAGLGGSESTTIKAQDIDEVNTAQVHEFEIYFHKFSGSSRVTIRFVQDALAQCTNCEPPCTQVVIKTRAAKSVILRVATMDGAKAKEAAQKLLEGLNPGSMMQQPMMMMQQPMMMQQQPMMMQQQPMMMQQQPMMMQQTMV
jgi:hypothetical protein